MTDLPFDQPPSRGLDELLDQHAVLAEALDALACLLRDTVGLDETRGDIALVLRLLDEYGCGYHIRLEEEVIFPRVARAGGAHEQALLAELRAAHQSLYRRVGELAAALHTGDLPLLAYHSQELGSDWAAHQARETDELLPLARGLFDAAGLEELDDAVEEFFYRRYQWDWDRLLMAPLRSLAQRLRI